VYSPTVKAHLFRSRVIGPLYRVGPFVICAGRVPSLMEQTVDYGRFLVMSALVALSDAWRNRWEIVEDLAEVFDAQWVLGALFGAATALYLMGAALWVSP
jgi:hypothetical protein